MPMNIKTILLTLLSTAACGVDAQQLYKSVGPDGKVTFSDRQPGGSGKISVMKSNILRPMEQDPLQASKLIAPSKPAASANVPARPQEEAAAPHAPSTPELEEAVSAVMLLSEVAKKFEPICSPTPKAAKQYSVAANGWKKRNANFIEQQNRILMEVIDPIKRAAMQNKVAARVDESLLQVTRLDTQWRSKWCDRAVMEMTSSGNDVANNASIAVPLITYKFK